jgi:hypothetical protein
MISLDWKERLIKDTDDFVENKLVKGDYQIGIIYNSYPVRAGHHIPHEVLSLVAKEICSRVIKNHKDYIEFYDYLWNEGGENGKFVATTIYSKCITKDAHFYFDKMVEYLDATDDVADITLLLDKLFLPLIKKYPEKYLAYAYNWIASNRLPLEQASIKVLVKFCKAKKDYAKPVLRHLENKWVYASSEMMKIYSQFLKEIGKFDKELFMETFEYYSTTHDPNIVEILTASVSFYDEKLFEIVDAWTKSGNARLKKSALNCRKVLKRKMK